MNKLKNATATAENKCANKKYEHEMVQQKDESLFVYNIYLPFFYVVVVELYGMKSIVAKWYYHLW